MKKIIISIVFYSFLSSSCQEHSALTPDEYSPDQIIANHSVIDDFYKIPLNYISEVKKMMICFPGESHSVAYRTGLKLLEDSDPVYTCNVSTGEAVTDKYLRVNAGPSTGEANWFTWLAYPPETRPAAGNVIKNFIKEYSDQGHPINALGFGWCWDMVAGSASSTNDPSFGCQWYGVSVGGPDGSRCWGLDAADFSVTGNRVSMDTYLSATEDYNSYCKTNNLITKVIFTTGPADSFTGEAGYQGYLKQQYIRNYVAKDSSRILFDYYDILCYDNNGDVTTTTWKGNTYPIISPANSGDGSIGHIGQEGAIRLAKAQWWILARIAGWDGK